MRRRQKLIVIVGPTASGKSELAVRLAKQYNSEIISADSRQVYRGLDVGTAKVTGVWAHTPVIPANAGIQTAETGFPIKSGMTKEKGRRVLVYKQIPHHCIDFVSARKTYSVAEFQQCAHAAITHIGAKGKMPILVGGTGLWIDAVVYDWRLPSVAQNPALRTRLEKKNSSQLLAMLRKLDPLRAGTIEQKNPRRLIRAIEITRTLGSVPKLKKHAAYDTLWIGLNPGPLTLERRIRNRARHIIHNGLISEIRKLLASRISKKRIREFGFEYRAGLEYLDGTLSQAGLLRRIRTQTRQYAKRQMTWFKRHPNIIWNPSVHETQKRVASFLP